MKNKCFGFGLLLAAVFCCTMCTTCTKSKPERPILPVKPSDRLYSWEKGRTGLLENTDLVLIYAGGKDRNPYEWDKDRFLPYVVYKDEEGKERWMFDSFLFIEFRSTDIEFCSGYGEKLLSASQKDWKELVDYYFELDKQIGALDKVIGAAVKRIGAPKQKHQVVINMPEPIVHRYASDDSSPTAYWGAVKDGRMLDFAKDADRVTACKWYIDYVRQKFDERRFKNVELAGFYWVAESAGDSRTILSDVSAYANSLHYSMNWIPYFRANGYSEWRDLGFNYAWYQPNYFFNESIPYARLNVACNEAKRFGLDMEMEFDSRALSLPEGYGWGYRLDDYMKAFRENGIWEKKRLAYYEGGGSLRSFYESAVPEDQERYHRFCHFVTERPCRKL